VHDDNARLSAADLLELNRDLQGSRAIRLLATTNLSLYATLMERHLSDGAVPETELVVRLERDLDDLDDPQSGLALIKSWASQGWLHRIVDERHDHNVCYFTQDARRALDFLRGMRRQDTIATAAPSPASPHASSRSPSKSTMTPPASASTSKPKSPPATLNSTNSTPASAPNPTSPTATTRPAPSPCRWNASSP
jgi:cell division septation protein DedD